MLLVWSDSCKVHCGSLFGLSCPSGVAGLFELRPGCRRVHPGSLGSWGCALGVVRFIRVLWVDWGAPWGS